MTEKHVAHLSVGEVFSQLLETAHKHRIAAYYNEPCSAQVAQQLDVLVNEAASRLAVSRNEIERRIERTLSDRAREYQKLALAVDPVCIGDWTYTHCLQLMADILMSNSDHGRMQ